MLQCEKNWKSKGKRGGLAALDAACKEQLDTAWLEEAADKDEIVLFGKLK